MHHRTTRVRRYLLNCFLLTVPIMVWNLILTNHLPRPFQPEMFWNNIPLVLVIGERASRIMIFGLSLLMPLSITSKSQKKGLSLYIFGVLAYFASWLPLIWHPESVWSNCYLGFMAPAYTPMLWLTGIALIGNKCYPNLRCIRWLFIILSVIFMLFHNIHAFIIYNRICQH